MKINNLAIGMFHAIAPHYSKEEIRRKCTLIAVFCICQPCNLLRFSDGKHEEEFCNNCGEVMMQIPEESMQELKKG